MNGMHRASLKRRLGATTVVGLVLLPIAFVAGAAGAPNQPTTIGIGPDDGAICASPKNTDFGVPDSQPAAGAKLSGHHPVIVTGSPSGDLFVSDGFWVRQRVGGLTQSPSTDLLTIAGLPANPNLPYEDFARPADATAGPAREKVLLIRGMAYHGGNLYLAEVATGNLLIRRLSPGPQGWTVTTIATGPPVGSEGLATGLAVLGNSLLVPQPEQNQVGIVNLGGGPIEKFISDPNHPQSVAVDGSAVVYVANAVGVSRLATPYDGTPQPVGEFDRRPRQVAVDPGGKTLFAASTSISPRTVWQVDLKNAPTKSEVLMEEKPDFGVNSLWYGGSPARLYLGTCRPRVIEPLAIVAPTTSSSVSGSEGAPGSNGGNGQTTPPGAKATGTEPKVLSAPEANTGGSPAPAGDSGGSQAAAPAAQVNSGAQGAGSPANAIVTPPGGGVQGVSGGAGSGNGPGGGGGLPPPPPPINTPTPQGVGGLAPGSLMPPPPSPSPHAGLATVPGDAALGAPRYAMVRHEPSGSPGPWVFAAGAVTLAGCTALCAIGLSKSRRGPQRAPAHARARAW